jgi:hypothetical protein
LSSCFSLSKLCGSFAVADFYGFTLDEIWTKLEFNTITDLKDEIDRVIEVKGGSEGLGCINGINCLKKELGVPVTDLLKRGYYADEDEMKLAILEVQDPECLQDWFDLS